MDAPASPRNHLTDLIDQDLASGRFDRVLTRFAPEPNAYLHVGHAFSIFMTYGLAERYGGKYNLRFDDTNPDKEKAEYVDAIREDIRWLGYEWEDREFFASDYFERLFVWACLLVRRGKAYVCDLAEEEVAEYRGTNAFREDGRRETPPGRDSPFRRRGVDENLDLFRRMRDGEFPEGARTLRARIDMAHPNLIMRDPIMYRIKHAVHHRTGSAWCIYPTYDFAHGQSDSMEGITHSICAMEFRHHRELYDWYIRELGIGHPRQVEYPRMVLSHTVTSKRLLVPLVERGLVSGWDDPRLPTVRGLRRRGVPAEAIRDFCSRLPIVENRRETPVAMTFFEHCVREHLNRTSPRVMAVLDPLRLVIEDEPEGEREVEAENNPEDPAAGTRKVPWSRELFIERGDFMARPVPGFRRLSLGGTVRLRFAGEITCRAAVTDGDGRVVRLMCTRTPADPQTRTPAGRTAILHWVSAPHALGAEVRLYDRLFDSEDPLAGAEGESWTERVNPRSLEVLGDCRVEPGLASALPGYRCQFERLGYFCVDPDSRPGRLVFNRTVALKDAWQRSRDAGERRAGSAPAG